MTPVRVCWAGAAELGTAGSSEAAEGLGAAEFSGDAEGLVPAGFSGAAEWLGTAGTFGDAEGLVPAGFSGGLETAGFSEGLGTSVSSESLVGCLDPKEPPPHKHDKNQKRLCR